MYCASRPRVTGGPCFDQKFAQFEFITPGQAKSNRAYSTSNWDAKYPQPGQYLVSTRSTGNFMISAISFPFSR